MELFKCAECVLRQSRPLYASRHSRRTISAQSIRHNVFALANQSRNLNSTAHNNAEKSTSASPDVSKSVSSLEAVRNIFNKPSATPNLPSKATRATQAPAKADTFFLDAIMDLDARSFDTVKEPLSLDPAPFRLGPTLGRTIKVTPDSRVDVGTAFRHLASLCAQNKVRGDLMSQRFHERPGLKRKRLKSQRYRLRFKAAFKETIQRVQKMRRMGY